MERNRRQAMGPSSKDAAPLRVWGWAIILSLLIFSILFFLYAGKETRINKEFLRDCRHRVQLFQRGIPTEGTRRVVMIGSSLLAAAARPSSLKEMAPAMGMEKAKFLTLMRSRGNIYHFLPLIEEIIELSPDLLLIESDLFFAIDYSTPYSLEFLRYLPKYINSKILSSRRRANRDFRLKRKPHGFMKFRLRVAHARMRKPAVRIRKLAGMVRRLQRGGVAVAIMDIPRSAPLEKAGLSQRNSRHRELMNFVRQDCRIPWLPFPRWLEPALYVDFSHFKPAGSRIFLKWLLPEIRRLLQQGAGK